MPSLMIPRAPQGPRGRERVDITYAAVNSVGQVVHTCTHVCTLEINDRF